jgi:energy-coupling factor transporter ATP-binding protein EcfA2
MIIGDERSFHWALTGRENLHFFAALHGLSAKEARRRTDVLLDRLGLTEAADRRFSAYSRGMKQRLAVARGLLGSAAGALLDEPTLGLDPLAARELRRFLRDDVIKREGRTALVGSNDPVEVRALADRVLYLERGTVRGESGPTRSSAGWAWWRSSMSELPRRLTPNRLTPHTPQKPGLLPAVSAPPVLPLWFARVLWPSAAASWPALPPPLPRPHPHGGLRLRGGVRSTSSRASSARRPTSTWPPTAATTWPSAGRPARDRAAVRGGDVARPAGAPGAADGRPRGRAGHAGPAWMVLGAAPCTSSGRPSCVPPPTSWASRCSWG